MPRLSDAVLEQVTERHRAVTLGLYHHAPEPGRLRRISDSLDDIPVLVERYREALAALDVARRWFDHEAVTYAEAANAVRAALGLESHEAAAEQRALDAGQAALRDGGAAGREA